MSKKRNHINNPGLFIALVLSAFLLLALASYTLSTPPSQRPISKDNPQ